MRPLGIAVACFPTLGGSGIVASAIGSRLAARGHRVRFFSRSAPLRLDLGAARVSLETVSGTDESYRSELAKALAAADDIDVIHAHYALPHALAALCARKLRRARGQSVPRIVCTLHGTDVTSAASDPERARVLHDVVAESDGLSVPSNFLRDQVRALAGDAGARAIDVIPNFVDPEVFRPRPGDLRELFPGLGGPGAWDDPAKRPKVLFHGSNFRAWKRVGDAVLALARIAERLEAGLVLVGDGPERAAVEALVAERKLEARVRFLGPLPHFADLLARADLFVLPSETESFGLAALEALASGVPVIASAVGGLSEVVRDGVTGLLVPPARPDALATAALTLLTDEPRRRELAAAARADALARFSPEPAVDRYERLLSARE